MGDADEVVVDGQDPLSPLPSPTRSATTLDTFLEPLGESDGGADRCGAKENLTQAKAIEMTWKHELERDGEDRRAPQISVDITTNRTHGHPLERQSVSGTRLSEPKRDKRVSLLTSINPKNIIDATDNEDEQSARDTPRASSLRPSSYSLRNPRATQGKLIYDVKYHPMDDSIRPSQAAKRRSLHGEIQLFSDDTVETFSVHDDSDEEEHEQIEEQTKPTKKGKKRARSRSRSPQPTRRSSRKTLNPRMSYNMNVHPQDRDLEVSSADDNDSETESPNLKRQAFSRSVRDSIASLSGDRTEAGSVPHVGSDATDIVSEQSEGTNVTGERACALIKTSSRLSSFATPPPYGIRHKEGLDVWMLEPGERYFRHDRDSWPDAQGLPFEIYTERLEDQLAAEATAASPLNFKQDDKENEVINNRLEETVNPTQGISIIPLSHYRRSSDDNIATRHELSVRRAFYDSNHDLSPPYGLGGSDGIHEQYDQVLRKRSMSEAMSILTSGDKLPRNPSGEQMEDVDSVLALHSSTPHDVDSVLGRPSSIYGNVDSSSGL